MRLAQIGGLALALGLLLTPRAAQGQALADAEFVGKFGVRVPEGSGTLNITAASGVDSGTGEVYVSDTVRVQVFDAAGTWLRQWTCLTQCAGLDVNPVTGDVYVAHLGSNEVVQFTRNGAVVRAWGGTGPGNGTFQFPWDVAVDPGTGNVYVRDAGNALIQQFDSAGTFIRQFGGSGSGPGQFTPGNLPAGIAFDPVEQAVYTTDPAVHTVSKFDATGNFVLRWGGGPLGTAPGQFRWIRGIGVGPSGLVYVADTDNERISVFAPDGTFVRVFQGPHGVATGPFHPRDVTVNRGTGETYVNAAYAFRMDRFDANDVFVASFGGRNTTGAFFSQPRGIAVSPVNGDVYVMDSGHFLLKRFSSAGVFKGQWGGSAMIDGTLPGLFGFSGESALDVDPDGSVWTGRVGLVYADEPASLYIQKFDPAGNPIVVWPRSALVGTHYEHRIRDVAVDPISRNVWMTDEWFGRVRVHAPSSAQLFTLPGFVGPAGIALGNESAYVVEVGANRVRRVGLNGVTLGIWGITGSLPGQFRFDPSSSLAVGPSGDVYVADSLNHRIQRFDAEGNFLDEYGGFGTANGQFLFPMGVGFGPGGHLMFVADTINYRVQSFCLTDMASCLGTLDSDADERLDATDNCVLVPNPLQEDFGSVANPLDPLGQTPDGIGNVCQCGELTNDGIVDATDLAALRAHLADPSVSVPAQRCDVYGLEGCDVLDVATLARSGLGLPPGVRQICSAAAPL